MVPAVSVKLMARVFELDVCSSDKLLLLAMADHARDDGTGCYPSVATLARKTSVTTRSVRRILKRLKSSGLIVAEGKSRLETIEYTISLDRGITPRLFPPSAHSKPPMKRGSTPDTVSPPKGAAPLTLCHEGGDIEGALPLTQETKTSDTGSADSLRTKDRTKDLTSEGRLSPPSSSHLPRPQQRHKDIDRLADAAVELRAAYRKIPGYREADLKEDLKKFAADMGIQYFDGLAGRAGIIDQALLIAERRWSRSASAR
jgi:Helix-turn-helix domain